MFKEQKMKLSIVATIIFAISLLALNGCASIPPMIQCQLMRKLDYASPKGK